MEMHEWMAIINVMDTRGEPQGRQTSDGPVLVELVDQPVGRVFSDEILRVYKVVSASGSVRHFRVSGWSESYTGHFHVDSVTEVRGREIVAYEWEPIQ